ncbi:MAG: hypothetical protein R6U66_14265 [Bacteroidales bacterium]
MKNKFILLSILFIAIFGFFGCEEDETTFSQSDAFVNFDAIKNLKIAENSTNTLAIPLNFASTGGISTTVTLETNVEGISNPAIVGEDFEFYNREGQVIETLNFTFDGNSFTDTLYIKPIDNDERDRDKAFNLKIASATNEVEVAQFRNEYTITISDDEHPLALILGEYSFSGVSAFADSDVSGNILIEAVPDDETMVTVSGMPVGNVEAADVNSFTCSVDIESKTITILAGQPLFAYGDYGDFVFTKGGIVDDSLVAYDDDIIGTIDASGNITTTDYYGYHNPVGFWNFFISTTWTKL